MKCFPILSVSCILIFAHAIPAQTTRPADKNKTEYFHQLFRLNEDDQYRKGRERAEHEYARGDGEIEGYGMLPVRLGHNRYLDEKTGLYARAMGCCIIFQREVTGHNEHLQKLVKERGLPANAVYLNKQYEILDTFPLKQHELDWRRLPPVLNGPTKRISVGDLTAQLDRKESPYKLYNLKIRHGEEEMMTLYTGDQSPFEIAYWKLADALVVKLVQPRIIYRFIDCKYWRDVWEYDPILLEQLENSRKRLDLASKPAAF